MSIAGPAPLEGVVRCDAAVDSDLSVGSGLLLLMAVCCRRLLRLFATSLQTFTPELVMLSCSVPLS